jgi:hypothetical protein
MERTLELEKTIRNAKGINVDFRQQLITACESEEGKKELPVLINRHPELIAPTLLPALKYLCA